MSKPNQFVLQIQLGNDGMRTRLQLLDAMRKVIRRLAENAYPMDEEIERGIMDVNGNTVGHWALQTKE